MNICFYYSFPVQKNWNDSDLEGSGLPGSESAIVHISRELARRHEVTVYNATSEKSVFNGVRYINLKNFSYSLKWDVFIAVRGRPPCLSRVPAKLKLYWSIEEGDFLVRDWDYVLPYVKKVVTISPFHTKLLQKSGVPPCKIWETRLGVNYEEYKDTVEKVHDRLIYCSIPGKGLDKLLKIYPDIKKEIPSVHLVVTGDYSLRGRKETGLDKYIKMAPIRSQVIFLHNIKRDRLILEQKRSWLHVYPCNFEELFCLSAMECQAAGTPTVCTELGALPTTIKDGFTGRIIRADKGEGTLATFTKEVISLLKDPVKVEKMAQRARGRALKTYTYQAIVREWESFFKKLVVE